MEAIIPFSNARLFASALSCLQKIGKEVDFEMEEDRMILRVINDSKQAYCEIIFEKLFFEIYTLHNRAARQSSLKCKLPLKFLAGLFKSLRNVESVKIFLENFNVADRHNNEGLQKEVVFQFNLKHGIMKQHRLHFIDCEIYGADFNREDEYISYLSCSPNLVSTLISHVHGTEEILFTANQESIKIKSYFLNANEDGDGTSSTLVPSRLHTAMEIKLSEFDKYKLNIKREEEEEDGEIESPSLDLCFCYKEIRAVLSFLDTSRCPQLSKCHIYFSNGGKPLLLTSAADLKDRADDSTSLISTSLIIATAAVNEIYKDEFTASKNKELNTIESEASPLKRSPIPLKLNKEEREEEPDHNNYKEEEEERDDETVVKRRKLEDQGGSNFMEIDTLFAMVDEGRGGVTMTDNNTNNKQRYEDKPVKVNRMKRLLEEEEQSQLEKGNDNNKIHYNYDDDNNVTSTSTSWNRNNIVFSGGENKRKRSLFAEVSVEVRSEEENEWVDNSQ